MATITGKASELITFSRTSNATLTDSDGKIKWAPHNLLLASEQFDTASWLKANSGSTTPVVTANAGVAPNGTTTADRVDYGIISATGNISVVYQAFTAVATTYTASVYVKAFAAGDVGKKVWINCYDTAYRGVASVILTTDWQLLSTSVTLTAGSGREVYISTLAPNLGGENQGAVSVLLWGAHLYRSDLGGMKANTSAYPMYNPTTAKNLLGYSEDFSSWSAYNATATASAPAAPNGLTTADTLTGTIDASQHLAYRQYTAFVNATNYKLSVFAKAGTNNFLYLGAQSFGGAIFNLANGVVGSNIGGGSGSIQSIGNGWYRCIVSITATGTSSQIDVGVAPNGTSPTGSATGTIYIWGAQLSDSASLDTYVPNYGAAPTAAAYYGPRLDADPVTLSQRGLLVEELRTNLQLNSNVFGTSTFAATVVADAAASPSGLIDASSVACTSVGGRAILSTSVTSGVVYTFSAFIKAGTNSSAYIELAGTAGTGGAVVFNLSNGTVTSGTGGAIVPAPNGFYRCSVTSTATGTGASDIRIGTGDATSKTIFVYGAQLEAGSFATSYIPTGAATATRNADVASVSTQAFPYSASASSIIIALQHLTPTSSNSTNQGHWRLELAGTSIVRQDRFDGSANIAFRGLSIAVDTGKSLGTSAGKVATAFTTGDVAVVVNGGSAYTNASATGSQAADSISIGRSGSATEYINGHIRQITYIPRRLTNAELQTRTA